MEQVPAESEASSVPRAGGARCLQLDWLVISHQRLPAPAARPARNGLRLGTRLGVLFPVQVLGGHHRRYIQVYIHTPLFAAPQQNGRSKRERKKEQKKRKEKANMLQ